MRVMPARLAGEMPLNVFGFTRGQAVSVFCPLVIYDGTCLAIHDTLREVLPRRFKMVKPAVVELPTTVAFSPSRLCRFTLSMSCVKEGGCLLIHAKARINPQVLAAFREDGKRWHSLRNQSLKAIHTTLPKRQWVEVLAHGRWRSLLCTSLRHAIASI